MLYRNDAIHAYVPEKSSALLYLCKELVCFHHLIYRRAESATYIQLFDSSDILRLLFLPSIPY